MADSIPSNKLKFFWIFGIIGLLFLVIWIGIISIPNNAFWMPISSIYEREQGNSDYLNFKKANGFESQYIGPVINDYATYIDSSGKFGYVDSNYNIVIQAKYDLAWDFSQNGYALIQIGPNMCLIDRTGRFMITPDHHIRNLWQPNSNNICLAQDSDGKWGAINIQAEWVIEPWAESSNQVLSELQRRDAAKERDDVIPPRN